MSPVCLFLPDTALPTENAAHGAGDEPLGNWRKQDPKEVVEILMGTWNVVWSTLPLWKDKKDVCITYNPLPPHKSDPASVLVDDLVEYRKQSASSDSVKTSIKGVDTLESSAPNPLTFNWRGKGWLMIASSRWQLLGMDETNGNEPQWAVTYFSKTLFTPAGLDIYFRQPLDLPAGANMHIFTAAKGGEGASEDTGSLSTIKKIIQTLQYLEGPVGELARNSGFLVGHKSV